MFSLDSSDEDWPSSDSETAEEATMADLYRTATMSLTPLSPNSTAADGPPHIHPNHVPSGEHTAHQIIQLLQQMGGPTEIDRSTILDHDFMPCKCCTGGLIHV